MIVTYNRINCLQRNLQCVRNQTFILDKIYVIDNFSTDGTKEYLDLLTEEWTELEVLHLMENIGGAGGFYTGIRVAFENGADWVWGMDDDAYPERDALEIIVDFAEKDNYQNVYWSNCNNDVLFENSVKKVSEWMFVGFLLTKKAVELAGLPRSDFFIYHDDVEYAYRIQKAGLNIYKVRDSIVKHSGNVESVFYEKKIGNFVLKYPMLSEWKQYYYIRNYILRYENNLKMKIKTILFWMPWFFVKLCILQPKLLPSFCKGYFHGIFGITGIKERP